MLLILHNMLNVDIGRLVPAERLIKKRILRSRSKVLISSYNVSNTHKVIINNVCEVICRHTVGLDKDLVIKLGAVNLYVTVELIVEGYLAVGDSLSYDIGLTLSEIFVYLLLREVTAVPVIHRSFALSLLLGSDLIESFLIAEAIIGLALFHELLSVLLEHTHSFGLNIGTYGTAYIGALIPVEAYIPEGIIYHINSTLYIAFLIGILYS